MPIHEAAHAIACRLAGAKVGEALPIDEVNPVDIPLTELQRLLKDALDQGDYRGAIRIYFIFILRALSKKKWIQWEKEKTNFSYLVEMRKNELSIEKAVAPILQGHW